MKPQKDEVGFAKPLPGYIQEAWDKLSARQRSRVRNSKQRVEYNRKWATNNRKKHLTLKRKWRLSNPEKHHNSTRKSFLERTYSISVEVYKEMLEHQQGCCAICRTDSPDDKRKYFCVDHDHTTGKVRGLLCNNCNRALGLFGDNADTTLRATNYLKATSDC